MHASRGIPVPIGAGALRNSKLKIVSKSRSKVVSLVALRKNQSPYFFCSCGDFTFNLRCKVAPLWELILTATV